MSSRIEHDTDRDTCPRPMIVGRILTCLAAVSFALIAAGPAVGDDEWTLGGNLADQRSADASDPVVVETAQFALPKRPKKGKGKAPPPSLPKILRFEYALATELEVPYTRDADLDRRLPDDSLIATPTPSYETGL